MELTQTFTLVRPIVYKMKRTYYIQLWDNQDWEQEGLICLHDLLESQPDLLKEQSKLFTYFKTKFSNRILDLVRHQESKKRQFNKMAYEEIGDVAHMVADKSFTVEDRLTFRDCLASLEGSLSSDEKDKLQKVFTGQRFAGKKQFIRRIGLYFTDFADYA